MTTTLNMNQFALQTVQGQTDESVLGTVVTCQISGSETATLVPGQAVKLEDSATAIPSVLALAANTDKTFGFIARTLKDQSFSATTNNTVEIALNGTLMYMTAGAAIARGAKLEVVYTTNKVITNAGVNPVVGWAFDKAAADGDLIRVFIQTPVL